MSTPPPSPHPDVLIPLPPNAPHVRRNAFTRWIGRSVLRLGGWHMVGEFPDVSRLVVIAAPHTSNWDAVWGLAAKLGLGLELRVLGKQELFVGPLGWLLHRLGVIPIDRDASHGVLRQAAQLMRDSERIWFTLAPEGTRKPVTRWKTGFWKIARTAGVPILPMYFHYPDRILGIGPLFHPGDDMDADIAAIRAWYAPWTGRHQRGLGPAPEAGVS